MLISTRFTQAPPTSLEAIETVLGQDVLHEYHHLVFWALDRIARDNMQQLAMGTESDELFDSTEEAWEACDCPLHVSPKAEIYASGKSLLRHVARVAWLGTASD